MGKSITTPEFVERATAIHGQTYDYSPTIYINAKTKVKIKCKKHGIFEQQPQNHLQGKGCEKCSYEARGANKRKSTSDTFIQRATKVHGDTYDYSKTVYYNSKTKVKIICQIHGEFEQLPFNHLSGYGCHLCFGTLDYTISDFITKANIIHQNKYEYTDSVYVNAHTKLDIMCHTHGTFQQTPSHHIQGRGCPHCKESIPEKTIRNILDNLNIPHIQEYRFNDCRDKYTLPFDFYIPSLNLCIEYDGEYHYKSIISENHLLDQQRRDNIKTRYCKENNIELLRIPYFNLSKVNDILELEVNRF